MAFSTLLQEATLLNSLLSSGRVAADVVATSALGNPIRLLRIGIPPPTGQGVLLLTGCLHGPEKAGREALLSLASRLASTSDQDEVDFLETYGLLIMPTCNPDGVHLNQRENSNGVNPNADHITLAAEETRAVAHVLSTYRPALVVDIHQGEIGSDDAQLLHPTVPGVHSVVVGRSQDAVAGIATYLAGQSLTPGVWPGSTNGQVLRNCAGLRNLASVIAECDSTINQTQQTAICAAVAEGALLYARTNAADLLDDVATADGTAVELVLPSGAVTPSPAGYRLPDLPGVHVTGFGLPVLPGGVVALSRPVVGYLLDEQAPAPARVGARLSSLTVPLLRYSHTVTYLTPGAYELDPGGDMLLVEVKGGSGGGGGATATGSGQTSGGGGGGGGEYRSGWITSTAGTVTVGAGGTGGTGQGGNGQASSFAGITAAGGLGGFHRAASPLSFDTTPGGVGGSTGTGGDFSIPGGPGGAYVGSAGRACGGQGGDSHWGGGGRASTGINHEWGRANGGGGAGAGNHANQPAQPGRNGAPGAVRVHVYVEET